MEAERTKIIDGQKVEEFYWAGKYVVYINDKLTKMNYADINSKTINLTALAGRK